MRALLRNAEAALTDWKAAMEGRRKTQYKLPELERAVTAAQATVDAIRLEITAPAATPPASDESLPELGKAP
jgi:hypothetical protein